MIYFCAELVQLIVIWNVLELKCMKKNSPTVDAVMLEDELWMRQCEKLFPNHRSRFFENRTAETWVFGFLRLVWFGLVFRKLIWNILIGFCTPLLSLIMDNADNVACLNKWTVASHPHSHCDVLSYLRYLLVSWSGQFGAECSAAMSSKQMLPSHFVGFVCTARDFRDFL